MLLKKNSNNYAVNYILNLLIKYISHIKITDEFIKIKLVSKDYLGFVLNIFNKHTFLRYKVITDICCSDFIDRAKRFEIDYNLLSIDYNSRLIISVSCDKLDVIRSITDIYLGADWLEREVWDMYGIFFMGHKDLRRILTDYGFEGYPFRKDFPLNGYLEIRYDEDKQYLIYEPIELMQNMRSYSFTNPLLNKKYIL